MSATTDGFTTIKRRDTMSETKKTMTPVQVLHAFFGTLTNAEILTCKRLNPAGLREMQELAAIELDVELVTSVAR